MGKFFLSLITVLVYAAASCGIPCAQVPAEPPYRVCWELDLPENQYINIASDNETKIFLLMKDKDDDKENKEKNKEKTGGEIAAFELAGAAKLWKTSISKSPIDDFSFNKQTKEIEIGIKGGDERISVSAETGLLLKSDESKSPLNNIDRSQKPLEKLEKNSISLMSGKFDFSADERGNIFGRFNDKPLWVFKTGGKITSIFAGEEFIYAASLDNFLYAFTSKGELSWKKRFNGRIISSPLIFEKQIVINTLNDNKAYLIDARNGDVSGLLMLPPASFFVAPLLVVKDIYIFRTDTNLTAFSKNCL